MMLAESIREIAVRVGLYIPALDKSYISGPDKYQMNLAHALADLNEVELLLLHHRPDVHHLGISAKDVIVEDKKPISWELKLRKINLHIIHFNVIYAVPRIFFPILNCKKVVTVHGDEHWLKEISGKKYNRLNYRIRRLIEPLLCKHIDMIIAVSYDLKRRLVKFLKIPSSKVKVIHEGVSPLYRQLPDAGYVKKKYSISLPFIFHVSNLSPKKNPQTLFKTFSELINDGFDLQLVIAGARWSNIDVNSIIGSTDLTRRIKILGYVPEHDLVSLYNAAEVFFFPSLHETFGFPVLEAMACGTPVVTSNVYSIPEISGDAAVLCPSLGYMAFKDAIERILQDAETRKKMISEGLENAKKFSWKKCAEETVKVYRQLF
jgi:glycosyltransferase involved in cell wall biosynthesis